MLSVRYKYVYTIRGLIPQLQQRLISPVGLNVKTAWNNILEGFCGMKQLKGNSYKSSCIIAAKIAAKIAEKDRKYKSQWTFNVFQQKSRCTCLNGHQETNMKWSEQLQL